MPLLDKKPKWIVFSKTFIGALFMVIAVTLGPMGFDFSFIQEFLNGAADEGLFTIGTLLTLGGRYFAERKVVLWPTEENLG